MSGPDHVETGLSDLPDLLLAAEGERDEVRKERNQLDEHLLKAERAAQREHDRAEAAEKQLIEVREGLERLLSWARGGSWEAYALGAARLKIAYNQFAEHVEALLAAIQKGGE